MFMVCLHEAMHNKQPVWFSFRIFPFSLETLEMIVCVKIIVIININGFCIIQSLKRLD